MYGADYDALGPLQLLAGELGIAIVVVHHLRKMEADDPLDQVSGTTGMIGAADTVLVLRRNAHGTTLYGRGREIEEVEAALRFDMIRGQWTVIGDAADVRRSDERKAILDVIAEAGRPMGPTAIAPELGKQVNTIKQLLFKMAKDGELRRIGRGRYGLPSWSEPDNFDNPVTGEQEATEA